MPGHFLKDVIKKKVGRYADVTSRVIIFVKEPLPMVLYLRAVSGMMDEQRRYRHG
jgi:hypothetical protein